MIGGWLVDTQLLVDWCLWALSEAPNAGPLGDLATRNLSKLRYRTHFEAFEHYLKPKKVLLAGSALVEAGGVLQNLLGHSHHPRGEERRNEPIVRATLQFTDHFNATLVNATEAEATKSLSKLNRGLAPETKLIDFGDAALIAALNGERRLLTADGPLFTRCVSTGRTDVYCFQAGTILDSRRQAVRGS